MDARTEAFAAVSHQGNISAFLPDVLVQRVQEIANRSNWTMTRTYDTALKAFYMAWYAGETPHRYQGGTVDARWRTLWVAQTTADAIRLIAKSERVSLTIVIQEALLWYCEQQDGRPVAFCYQPPDNAPPSLPSTD